MHVHENKKNPVKEYIKTIRMFRHQINTSSSTVHDSTWKHCNKRSWLVCGTGYRGTWLREVMTGMCWAGCKSIVHEIVAVMLSWLLVARVLAVYSQLICGEINHKQWLTGTRWSCVEMVVVMEMEMDVAECGWLKLLNFNMAAGVIDVTGSVWSGQWLELRRFIPKTLKAGKVYRL